MSGQTAATGGEARASAAWRAFRFRRRRVGVRAGVRRVRVVRLVSSLSECLESHSRCAVVLRLRAIRIVGIYAARAHTTPQMTKRPITLGIPNDSNWTGATGLGGYERRASAAEPDGARNSAIRARAWCETASRSAGKPRSSRTGSSGARVVDVDRYAILCVGWIRAADANTHTHRLPFGSSRRDSAHSHVLTQCRVSAARGTGPRGRDIT